MYEPSEELRNRPAESTTFESCGWCRWAMGEHRYSYCIQGKCQLIDNPIMRITWDTKCLFIDMTSYELENVLKYHQDIIDKHTEYIKQLSDMGFSFPYTPPLPINRPMWDVNQEVAYYMFGNWYKGHVTKIIDDKTIYIDGAVSVGISSTTVMALSDYEWFMEHPDKYLRWHERIAVYSGYEPNTYIELGELC